MLDFNDFLIAMKKAAVEAVEASKPTRVVYGKVISSSPLKVNLDQKLNLSTAQLILTRNVSDFTINTIIDGIEKQITVKNSLSVGDKVVLIQVQGGQQYIVLDRIA